MNDFTYESYRSMVHRLRESGYTFAMFPDVDGPLADGRPYVLLRHDIDLSLGRAVPLAAVEAELGVASTYFVMLRNDFYNAFSGPGTRCVQEILRHGHALGLHFNCAAYPQVSEASDLASYSSVEASILSRWFDAPVSVVSYHRPQPIVLSGDPRLSHPLPHTYLAKYVKDIRYLSDSHGRWKFGSPLESDEFARRRSMHVLTHPIWWTERASESRQKLEAFLERRNARMRIDLASNCTIYPRPEGIVEEDDA
jgi:hypothetical protein